MPDNNPSKNQWFTIDPPGMLQHAVGADTPMYTMYVEATDESPAYAKLNRLFPLRRAPKDFATFYVTPEKHMIYATTWFVFFLVDHSLTPHHTHQTGSHLVRA